MKKLLIIFSAVIVVVSIGLAPLPSSAQDENPFLGGSIVPDKQPGEEVGCRDSNRGCNLTHIQPTVANVVNIVLFVAGSGLLLMLTYGGLRLVFSTGNQEQVTKGKEAIKAGVIGMLFVLGSWLIINTLLNTLTAKKVASPEDILNTEPAKILDQPFNEAPFDTEEAKSSSEAPAPFNPFNPNND